MAEYLSLLQLFRDDLAGTIGSLRTTLIPSKSSDNDNINRFSKPVTGLEE